jgi:hypothetical protein
MQKLPISAVKSTAVLLARTATAVDKIAVDGKLGVDDAAHVMGPITSLPGFLAEAKDLPSQFLDMDEAEAAEVKEAVKAELDLSNDKAEAVAEEIAGLAFKLTAIVLQLRAARVPASA